MIPDLPSEEFHRSAAAAVKQAAIARPKVDRPEPAEEVQA